LREIRQRFWNANKYIAFGVHELVTLKLDTIHPTRRFPFLKLKKKVQERYDLLKDSLDSLIRRFAKSDFLDDDQNKKESNKRRKKYLREQKAIPVDRRRRKSKKYSLS
jgi:hypothetical protein